MQKLGRELQEFVRKVLFDEEPVFISDEATIWDISTLSGNELLERFSKVYGISVSLADLSQPFWKLLRQLNGMTE